MPKRVYTKRSFSRIKDRFSNQFAITSRTGVGGSTLVRGLRRKLGAQAYSFVSGGDFMRKKARALGFGSNILAFAEHNKQHPELGFDRECDEWIMGKGLHNFTIGEGRLVHLFMPYAFKVLLICPPHVRANRRAEDNNEPLEKVTEAIVMRDIHDEERYDEKYPGWNWDKSQFDLVIDTSVHTPKETLGLVLSTHMAWLSCQKYLITGGKI